ncbi:hypothetical protein TKK_0001592 [Trichogramma kaykai]
MTPVSVNLNNAALARKNLENRYKLPPSSYNRRKKLKYKIGDLVRISRAKNAFAKGYEGGWTIEIFKIKHTLNASGTGALEDSLGDARAADPDTRVTRRLEKSLEFQAKYLQMLSF